LVAIPEVVLADMFLQKRALDLSGTANKSVIAIATHGLKIGGRSNRVYGILHSWEKAARPHCANRVQLSGNSEVFVDSFAV
jgi:hypothetical protein